EYPEWLAGGERAVMVRDVVSVEGVDRRAGRAVALRVVLPAVAGTPEARDALRGDQPDRRAVLAHELLGLPILDEPVRLRRTAEMRTAIRDDREARLRAVLGLGRAVVADESGAAVDLARL